MVSFVLGAAALGGYACARIPVLMAAQTPAERSTGEVENLDAMMKAKQPVWVAVANPFVGLVGVLIGARLRRSSAAG
jgi:hypothetical protein